MLLFLHFLQKGGFQPIFVKWQGKHIFVGKQEMFRQKAAPPSDGFAAENNYTKAISCQQHDGTQRFCNSKSFCIEFGTYKDRYVGWGNFVPKCGKCQPPQKNISFGELLQLCCPVGALHEKCIIMKRGGGFWAAAKAAVGLLWESLIQNYMKWLPVVKWNNSHTQLFFVFCFSTKKLLTSMLAIKGQIDAFLHRILYAFYKKRKKRFRIYPPSNESSWIFLQVFRLLRCRHGLP